MGLVVGREDARGDAATVADLLTVLARPLPDCAQIAATLTSGSPCLARALTAAGTASMVLPGLEVVAQFLGVSRGQVNLIRDAVKRERYGLNRVCAVDVVRSEEHTSELQ